MGNCCNKEVSFKPSNNNEYLRTGTINIIKRNYLGNQIGTTKVSFENTSPIKLQTSIGSLGNRSIKVHGCIVPGLDPRGEMVKECQDNYIFFIVNNSVLCALFDGHGKEGQKIATFCIEFVGSYFKKYIDKFETNPEETLGKMLEKCDRKLNRSRVPNEMAGSTAVAIYINSNNIYSASLGDSRGIISTISDVYVPAPIPTHNFYKPVSVKRYLKPVALTTDQKPNHEDEFARIKDAGGSVEQITDEFGRPVGPYRVWVKDKDFPGLAMSRSIGDRIAKRVGVIAKPVCHDFKLYEADQFIVIASDGVWDVMENIEVVNFVDKFRNQCVESTDLFPAKPENSSIARMLCEEARYRWYGIIEAEDVMIDDISCIIIELDEMSSPSKTPGKERNVQAFLSIAIAPDINNTTSTEKNLNLSLD